MKGAHDALHLAGIRTVEGIQHVHPVRNGELSGIQTFQQLQEAIGQGAHFGAVR